MPVRLEIDPYRTGVINLIAANENGTDVYSDQVAQDFAQSAMKRKRFINGAKAAGVGDLTDQALMDAAQKAAEAFVQRKEDYKTINPSLEFFYSNQFRPDLMGNHLLKDFTIKVTPDTHETWIFAKNKYIPAEAILAGKTQEYLGTLTRQKFVKEALFWVGNHSPLFTDRKNLPINLIPFQNGTYNLETKQLEAFNSKDFFWTWSLPDDYDPTAQCPRFEQFLTEVLSLGDEVTIWDIIGYGLIRDQRFQIAVMLCPETPGMGAGGKSVLLKTIKYAYGEENVSSESLQKITGGRFGYAPLYEKLANICNELPQQAIQDSGPFKQITGGDPVSIEFKGKMPFSSTINAKMIYAANNLPKFYDESHSVMRRWVIVQFPYCFEGKEEPLLEQTLKAERKGILRKAVETAAELIKLTGIRLSDNIKKSEKEYARISNPLNQFVAECIEYNPDFIILKADMYAAYGVWCDAQDIGKIDENWFHKDLRTKLASGKWSDQRQGTRTGYQGVKVVGVDLKPESRLGYKFEKKKVEGEQGKQGILGETP